MDNLEIVGGVIVFVTNLYLGMKANQIFQRTNEIMEHQIALEHPGTTMANKPSLWRTYWPLLAMGLLTVLTWSAVGYDIYDRHEHHQGEASVHLNPLSELSPAQTTAFTNAFKHAHDAVLNAVEQFAFKDRRISAARACRIEVIPGKDNIALAKELVAIAKAQGCEAINAATETLPLDADQITSTPEPQVLPYIVVRTAPLPELQPEGFQGMWLRSLYSAADDLTHDFRAMGIDARRSHRVSWQDAGTIYIELGTISLPK